MRVLMTADTVGGVWTYAVTLGGWLARHGVCVTVATMGSLPTAEQQMAATKANVSLEVSRYKLEWMDDPWTDVEGAGPWLLSLEKRLRPDIVHLNGYAHAAIAWNAPKLVVAHSCVLSWWRAVFGEDAPAKYARYRREVEAGLSAADVVVAPTRAMRDELTTHYASPARARVIANGAALPHGAPEAKRPIILCAGRLWDHAKNARVLSTIAHRLPWPIYMAGDEAPPSPGARSGVDAGGVSLLGRLDPERLAAWMRRASIFAAPSVYEPFGLSALEAALAGCALVLGDIPSLREVWSDAAVFVPARDPDAITAALTDLVQRPEHLADMASRARRRASQYTVDRMGRSYLSLYRDLRSGASGRPQRLTELGR